MRAGPIEGCTRRMAAGQSEFDMLEIRDEPTINIGDEQIYPSMVSLWYPSEDELFLLARGSPVVLRILGDRHPPVSLEVGAPPPPE